MNTSSIEGLAANHIERIFLQYGYTQPFIKTNDKTPSWDGHLFFYNNVNKSKSDLIGTIPVQIKGTTTEIGNGKLLYPCDTVDLKNYRNNNGCLYFVVYINLKENYYKSYYANLLPYELSLILNGKEDQKSISVEFIPFPEQDYTEITHILTTFIINLPKQIMINGNTTNFINNITESYTEIDKYSFEMMHLGDHKFDLDNYLINHQFYIYGKPKGLNTDIIIGKASFDQLLINKNYNIKINNIVYYDNYKVTSQKEKRTIIIGESIYITHDFTKNTDSLSIKLQGTITCILKDCKFMMELLKHQVITINNIDFNVNIQDGIDDNFIKNTIIYFETAKKVLDKLGVKKELIYASMNKKDRNNLKSFILSYLDNEELLIRLNEAVPESYCKYITIGNITIMLWVMEANNGYYKVENFFKNKNIRACTYNPDDKELVNPIETSRYFILTKDLLKKISNLDYELMMNDIKSLPLNDNICDQIVSFCLEMIHAFDIQEDKDDNLLDYSEKLLNLVYDSDKTDKDRINLNKIQIIKRKRELTIDEKAIVSKYIIDDKYPLDIQCGSRLLLDDDHGAQKCFDKMTIAEQCMFLTFPICKFGNLKRRNDEETPNGQNETPNP